MENHPIPQDVTSFQFKLIGEMTIKQFAYLAAGLILAWICFALPLAFLIKLPFMILFGLTGVVLAFIPVEGRPADLMLFHFFRALFAPNQYIFQKSGETRIPTIINSQAPSAIPQSPPQTQQVTPKPTPVVKPIASSPVFQTRPTPVMQHVVPQPTPAQSSSPQPHASPPPQPPMKETEDALSPSSMPPAQQKTTPLLPPVQSPSKQPPPAVGMPLTPDVPNLIAGIVKDPRGNVLPNMLVEVKDKDENPVRAFKTNALGQFVSATPLLNGEYTVSFEDPAGKQLFDPITVIVRGEIIQPLLIISRDAREELRKELFGK